VGVPNATIVGVGTGVGVCHFRIGYRPAVADQTVTSKPVGKEPDWSCAVVKPVPAKLVDWVVD
jgi:hypothetical protein